MPSGFAPLTQKLSEINPVMRYGTISRVTTGFVEVDGLSRHARIGDLVSIDTDTDILLDGEIVALSATSAVVMTYGTDQAPAIGDLVLLNGPTRLCPSDSWLGRVIDAFGAPLDGRPLMPGSDATPLRAAPPDPGMRRGLGERLRTGLSATDTMLPLAKGQRIGVFAGSGVGKTTLLGDLAKGISADCVVIGLIGERGREVREFVDNVLGTEGMARAVVVAATSDQSPLIKRRAAWTATAVAERYRDQGKNVLLIIDSLTRFAEAHREVALTAGETPSLRAYPPSTANIIAALTERAGTGAGDSGDITAIYSVLVAGSDMEEPVADITRGVLDGHVILDRAIAERGRFPAIDVRRSVSRSLPAVASEQENELIAKARAIVSTYENSATLIQAGLYQAGADPALDHAVRLWPALDAFFATKNSTPEASFAALEDIIVEKPPEAPKKRKPQTLMPVPSPNAQS